MDQYNLNVWDIVPQTNPESIKPYPPADAGRTVEICGKFFTPDEAREIDEGIAKLDALIRQRRARVLEAMRAEECSCSACETVRTFIRHAVKS